MTPEELAKRHADWTAEFVRKVYFEAFKHGFKHGKESKE
jgi:hypothetical protein